MSWYCSGLAAVLLCLPGVRFLNKKDHNDGLRVPADLVTLLLSAPLLTCAALELRPPSCLLCRAS